MANCICQQLIILFGIVLAVFNATADDSTQLQRPSIVPLEEEILLQKGQNYTLYCNGQNPLQFKQQDVPEEVTGLFNKSQRIINSTEIALDLYNVDEFAIGYYACFDETINESLVLKNVLEEPQNTNHISYIYVYVDGTDKLFAPMREMVKVRNGSKIAIECRPTTPDVNITLDFAVSSETDNYSEMYNPKIGFVIDTNLISYSKQMHMFTCLSDQNDQSKEVFLIIDSDKTPLKPNISSESPYFIKGESFTLTCKVPYQHNEPCKLDWAIPNPKANISYSSNVQDVNNNPYVHNVTVYNASKSDEGVYKCIATINSKSKSRSYQKQYFDKGFVTVTKPDKIKEIKEGAISFRVQYAAYPKPKFSFRRDDKDLIIDGRKYNTKINDGSEKDYVQLDIKYLNVTDSGNYTITVSNDYGSDFATTDYRVYKKEPDIEFEPKVPKKYVQGTEASFLCRVIGYPLPNIQWRVNNENETMKGIDTINPIYQVKSILKVPVRDSLNITCIAGNVSETKNLLVYEIDEGFGIRKKSNSYHVEGFDFNVTCLASIYDFYNVTWINVQGRNVKVSYSRSKYSYISTIFFESCATYQAGLYECIGTYNNGSIKKDYIEIFVDERRQPQIGEPPEDQSMTVQPYQPISLQCAVSSTPRSKLEWSKDGIIVANSTDSNIEITNYEINVTTVKSVLQIKQMSEDNAGKYECLAWNGDGSTSRFYNVVLEEKTRLKAVYVAIIGVIMAALTLLVIYLAWKIRKEKKFRKQLDAAGLLYFKEGRKLNPNLGIDEQAELLPYDDTFEFPRDKLTICEPLGSGAFGEVYKAKAQGIINAERTDIVAVKMVRKTADNMCIKALASELKIMCHLGKHVNIVNLLGACTKDVVKRELIVIVEYCEFGNIHNYLQRHREVFIDQLTDNKEKNFGNINKAFSYSTNNSAGTNSEYFGKSQTHETEQTFLTTGNSSRSGRRDNQNKEADAVQASELSCQTENDWRCSKALSDYSCDGRKPRPLYSRDLLAWAFQIARGMEYLASRKVLHGDLAARNILLAKDNIVKICDFGLARSVYKNQEYQKQENSLLPVKWLAIECITDRIFSTQSDIWAYGIVLWELFSLAKTPYPNISLSQLHQWLMEGNRLEKPAYADDKLYEVMMQCWQQKPNARPSFNKLQEIIGSFLEENVRNHYVDLNTVHMDANVQREGEDYLAMVTAPDYNNMVTPSPHHYVNVVRSFFPPTPTTQLPHDDEGYLQMSPANNVFSPRFDGTKFDFDSKRLNSNSERNSHELTPMLTLNNLPARSGSESDHEGHQLSPYLKMCPKIEEESDEVFDIKQNNEKNAANTAVSNPTYITFTVDLEKNPNKVNNNTNNNLTNTYINMHNGLVK